MPPDPGAAPSLLRRLRNSCTATQATVAGLVLLAVLSLLPDFRDSVIPSHDARQTYSAFQLLVSGLRSEGEIPQWTPYGRYGASSFFVLLYVTPVAWLMALAAAVLPAVGMLSLFKLYVLLDFLLFLAGSIRLTLLLFRGLAPVALVNIGAILSFSWLSSLDGNFHLFYLLPFILDSLLRFRREGRFTSLLLAVLFCVVSAVGNVPYYPPIMALLLTVFCAVLAGMGAFPAPGIRFSRVDPFLAAGILVLAAAHVGGYWTGFRDLHFYTEGRDPETGKALFHFFLHFNGNSTLVNLTKVFLTGAHTHGDVTFYVGLAPLLLAFLAVSRCRRPEFFAVAAVAGFLVLFSFGGLVARAAYHFPGMAYYRHVGLIFGQAKYLLLLMAGFGLEALLQGPAADSGRPLSSRRRIVGLGVLAAAVLLIAAELVGSLLRPETPWTYLLRPVQELKTYVDPLDLDLRDYLALLIRLGVYGLMFAAAVGLARRRPSPQGAVPLFTGVLLLAFLIDLGSFKILQFSRWPAATEQERALARTAFTPRALPWRPVRVANDEELARNPEFRFSVEEGLVACVYVHVYSLAGVDPRMPVYRLDSLSRGIDRLLRTRGVEVRQLSRDSLLPRSDLWLLDALGARQPKLRLVAAADVDFRTGEEAVAAVRQALPGSTRIVVEATPEGGRSTGAPVGQVSVASFGFNHLTAEAVIEGSEPAWLYYADAYDPGWTATVDGRPVPISQANLGFKALPLPPGSHRVEFRYWNGWGSRCLYILCAGSLLFLAGLSIALTRVVLRNLRSAASDGR